MESERGWPDKAARDYYSKRAYILEKKIKSLGKADWLSKTTSQQACGFSGALDPTWLGGEGSRARRWYGWPPRQVCRPPAVHARGRTAQRAVGPGGPRPPGPEGGPPAREALRGAGRPPVTLRPRPPRSLRQEVLQRCSVLLVKRGHMANEAVTLHLGAAAFSQAQQCKVGVSRVLRKHPELKSHLALHKLVVKPSKRGRPTSPSCLVGCLTKRYRPSGQEASPRLRRAVPANIGRAAEQQLGETREGGQAPRAGGFTPRTLFRRSGNLSA